MDDGPLTDELVALREGAGVAAAGLRSFVEVSGDDHREWLDRISSMPILTLEPGSFTWSTLMDGKGKMRCDMPDLAESRSMVSVLGPRADAVLAEAGLPVPNGDQVATADGVHAMAARLYGVPGVDLLVDADAADALVDKLVSAGAARVGRAALDVVRVEAGVPWFAEDMADAVIPLEAGLDDHVSITKGCYPGQEVVARIANLGQVARKLVRLSAPGRVAAERGAELTGTGERDGKPAGSLTSVVHDPGADRTLALGYCKRAFWKEGSEVASGGTTFTVEGPARP
jgi:folate-binding protein YgfZ